MDIVDVAVPAFAFADTRVVLRPSKGLMTMFILQMIFWVLLLVFLVLMVALLLDWFLRSSLPSTVRFDTRDATPLAKDKRLIVYLPGILADAVDSSEGIVKVWRKEGDVLLVTYGGKRFRPQLVVRDTYDKIHEWINERTVPGKDFEVLLVGSSMGGLLAYDLGQRLGADKINYNAIVIDSPTCRRDFQAPLDLLSLVVPLLPFGPIFNVFSRLVMQVLFVPPKEENLEPEVDRKRLADLVGKARGYSLSFHHDQVMYIIRHGVPQPNSWHPRRLAYVRSMRDHDTVREQAAVAWENSNGNRSRHYDVDAAHAAFNERPKAYRDVFRKRFREEEG